MSTLQKLRLPMALATIVGGLAIAACTPAELGPDDREELVSVCTEAAQRASGLSSTAIQQVCGCTADAYIAEKMTMSDTLGTDRSRAITEACMRQSAAGAEGAAAPAAAM